MTERPATSRALVLDAPRVLDLRELTVPAPTPDTALLAVEACGLCGTDHELFTGALPLPTPLVPGHETVGTLLEVGDAAAEAWGVAAGDRVAVECFLANGLGLTGGWAEHHWLAPDSMVLPVPEVLDPVDATLFNPVGAGIRWGAELPATGPGDVVAVLGPGIRGLASAAAAKEAGADVVMVTGHGPNDHPRLEAARDFGADLVVDVAEQDPVAALRAATGRRGASVVVDVTANAPAALGQAVGIADVDARVVLAGTRNSDETPGFHPDHVVFKELRLLGALGVDAPAYRRALDLLASDRWPFRKVARRVEPLEGAADLLTTMAGEGDGPPPVHAVLVP